MSYWVSAYQLPSGRTVRRGQRVTIKTDYGRLSCVLVHDVHVTDGGAAEVKVDTPTGPEWINVRHITTVHNRNPRRKA